MAKRCDQCLTGGIALEIMRSGFAYMLKKGLKGRQPGKFSRLINEGYIYILDDKGKWYGYIVTEKRLFKSFTVTGQSGISPYAKEPDLPYKDSKCFAGDNCEVLNSFIRIPDPNKDIQNLWIAYSPVKWTKSIIDKHEKDINDAKKNNMVEIKVRSLEAGGKEISNKDSQKAGYQSKLNEILHKPDFEQQYFPIENYGLVSRFSYEYLIERHPKPTRVWDFIKEGISRGFIDESFVVVFYDPIGEMIDLNEYIIHFEESANKMYESYYIHRLDVGNKIKGLEKSIKSGIRSQVIDRYIEKKLSAQKHQYTTYRGARGHIEVVDYEKKEVLRRELDLTISEQQDAHSKADLEAEEVWSNYAKLYEKSNMEAFLNTGMGKRIKEESSSFLIDLLRRHKEVYESEKYKKQVFYNFDTQDVASGLYFSEKVFECIGVTVNYPDFIKRYADEINNKSLKDDDSYILRALVFNHQPVIDKVIEESEKNISWSSLTQAAWSSIFNGGATLYASNIIKNSAISQNAVAQLSAPLMQVIKEQANKPALSEATYALGFHLQKEITRIDFYGRRYQAISTLSSLLDKQNTSASNSTINRFAISIINQLKVEGNANFQQGVQGHMLALIDMKKAADILNNLELPNSPTGQGKKDRIAVIDRSVKPALISSGQAYDIGSNAYKRFVDPHTNPFGSAGKLAIAGGLFQTVACVSLLHAAITGSDSTQSSNVARAIENSEGWSKLAGGLGFLMGGILDRQANVLRTQLTNPALSKAQTESLVLKQSNRTLWAKKINIGSGAIFAAFDFYHAYDELNKGNMGTSGLFIISAFSGMGSVLYIGSTATLTTLGITMSWNLIGWALLAISIGVGIIISIVSNNPLQEWIENSVWGNDAINKSDYENDIKEYEEALKEMSE